MKGTARLGVDDVWSGSAFKARWYQYKALPLTPSTHDGAL